ncbi:MAG TPA: hypothetical protein VFE33_12625 [Thermoanaerobaculia bacterium]|nr:hypothetical protein [Thermoanaerobaculia bacterium]
MIVEPRIEKNIRQLAATFDDDIASIWLCGSRANGGGMNGADWDLVVFGERQVAEALERRSLPLGNDVDLRFVDVSSGEIKRLGKAAGWEDFLAWDWIPLSASLAEYQATQLSEHLVTLGGEWVEAGTLAITRKRAVRLWPEPEPGAPAAESYVH